LLPRAAKVILSACLCLVPAAAWAETHFEAAQRLLESGHETEARRALELELELRPNNLEARYNLAVLLARIGHRQEAVRLYRENMKRGRHLPSVVNLSAIYLKQGKRKEAVRLLQAASGTFRSEAVPWYLLAGIAEKEKQAKLADRYYRQSLKADRKNGFAHIRYARFLARHHRARAAAKHAASAVKLLPECAICFRISGDVFRQGGKKRQALIAYQKAAALAPDRDIRMDIIAMLETLGKHRRAARMKRALKH